LPRWESTAAARRQILSDISLMLEHMFEEEDPAGYDAWLAERAAALDLVDEQDIYEPIPQPTDAELAEWLAEVDGVRGVDPG
jgi:hypothetical protein